MLFRSATLYTTFFTHLSGAFSGSWQGMGYWVAQQEVARGNQPWYYYFVGLPVYELLPAVFGIAGAVYFIRRADMLGLALTFWAGVDRKSTRLNSSHALISYAVFCLKKKKQQEQKQQQ